MIVCRDMWNFTFNSGVFLQEGNFLTVEKIPF